MDDWPLAKLIYKPPGVPASWGSLRAEPFVLGLLLGRIGGVRETLSVLPSSCRPRSGEFRRGKQMRVSRQERPCRSSFGPPTYVT